MSETTRSRPKRADDPQPLELAEKGRRGGQEISLDRRLFMKFTAFGGCADPQAAIARARARTASTARCMSTRTTRKASA